jgi:hypothetical protein
MTAKRYTPAERAEIAKLLEAGEMMRQAARERAAAIAKAKRDIFQLREIGVLPPDDAT